MAEKLSVPPDPSRMVEGLRDTGYQFPTAVADLIDNSIAAGASLVSISVEMDFRGNVTLSIADNGDGMDRDGLIDAMKYGSQRRSDPASLGKFGLGLKTASTAFCRRLSVVTRNQQGAPALKAVWDLDDVAEAGEWILQLDQPDTKELELLSATADDEPGTVIIWNKVDRLMRSYDNPAGAPARRGLDRQLEILAQHLRMVFQRFLDQEDERAANVRIVLNGTELTAWDPFCVGVSDTAYTETVSVDLGGDEDATLEFAAYVLPRREEFPSQDARNEARLTNENQGIYVYRENRLIHGPGWLGMYHKEPHESLLRVSFSFDHNLDDAFHIDIKKSQIILNEDLFVLLKDEFLPGPRREAANRYRTGIKKKSELLSADAHDGSNAAIRAKEEDLGGATVNIIDAGKGEISVDGSNGTYTRKIKIASAQKAGQVHVVPVASMDDGVLWRPALVDGHKAVQIWTGHPYYHKVYEPNLTDGVTVQGMDSLLWALCAAELNSSSAATTEHFEDLRFEVSRLLRRLVEDLPEPAETDEITASSN